MKAWVTKYALTTGIQEVEGYIDRGMLTVPKKSGGYCDQYFHGNNWHMTKEAAIGWAEHMRSKKIASLEKQLQKLEKLKFT